MKIKAIIAAAFVAIITPFAGGAFAEDTISINSQADFASHLATPGSYRLDSDISLTDNMIITANGFVLDLNGHTINNGDKRISASGNVTIKDSSSTKTGKVTSTTSDPEDPARSVQVTGTFTLESGTLEGNSSYAILVGSTGKVTIKGGTVITNYYSIVNGGTVTVNGGLVQSTSMSNPTYYGQSNSKLIQNGGTIKTDGDAIAINLSKPYATYTLNDGLVEAMYVHPTNNNYGGAGVCGFQDTEIFIHGGKIKSHTQAICGNGSRIGERNSGVNMKLTITGGELISDTIAIYIPQINGETKISGGTITGQTDLEIRAGKLLITGGTFIAGDEPYQINPNNNGSNSLNVAVSVVQHTTKQPIEVVICGGTFKGNLPFAEANSMHNPASDIAKISIDIAGESCSGNITPSFISTGETTIYSEDLEKFIYGGRYTHSTDKYMADEHGEIQEDDGMIAVYPYRKVEAEQPKEGGTVEISKEQTLRGTLITINPKPKPGFVVVSIDVIDANGNHIPVRDNKYYAPDSDTKVYVKFGIANPETSNDRVNDYGVFIVICTAAAIFAVSSFILGRHYAKAFRSSR